MHAPAACLLNVSAAAAGGQKQFSLEDELQSPVAVVLLNRARTPKSLERVCELAKIIEIFTNIETLWMCSVDLVLQCRLCVGGISWWVAVG